MSQYGEQPPQHPAATYYPAPGHTVGQAKDLTAMGVLAFSFAALVTVFALVDSSVVGTAVRHADDETLHWSVGVMAIGSLLSLLATVAGWITASMWLFRARTNADAMEPGRTHARSPGWAWGGWVCPIVSLWFPFQVVRDVHKAISPLSVTPLIGWWWGLFLFGTVGDRIADRIASDATPADASGVQAASVFFALVQLATLVTWGLVLRTITREQHARMYGART